MCRNPLRTDSTLSCDHFHVISSPLHSAKLWHFSLMNLHTCIKVFYSDTNFDRRIFVYTFNDNHRQYAVKYLVWMKNFKYPAFGYENLYLLKKKNKETFIIKLVYFHRSELLVVPFRDRNVDSDYELDIVMNLFTLHQSKF